MISFLSNGGFSKMLWIILTFLVALGALIVVIQEIVTGQTPNGWAISILASVLSHAFTIGGSVNTSTQIEKQQNIASTALAESKVA